MGVRVESTTYGAAALGTLRRVVAELKGDDPMRAVTVIVPNNLAGIVARRHLARGLAPEAPGVAGIEITTLSRLAERMANPSLAPRRPATSTVVAAAWRLVLARDPGVFGEIADHPATVGALAHAYRDLRELTPAALEAAATATSIGSDLVARHRDVVGTLESDWYDAVDVLDTATAALDGAGGPQHCILVLPQSLSRSEAGFAAALSVATDVTVVAALTGVERADRSVQKTLHQLGATAEATKRISTAQKVVTASDSDDEVRWVVRDVVEALKTTRADRIAVLWGAASPYSRLVHEQLTAAGITINGTGTRPASERAVARLLLELLRLPESDVPRPDLFRALANAPVRDFAGTRIPIARWERMSRSAGVVSGDDWNDRLDSYIDHERAAAKAETEGDAPRQWLIDRRNGDADVAEDLRAFAVELRTRMATATAMRTWRELASWCQQLLDDVLGTGSDLQKLPPEEQYSVAAITLMLSGLSGLDSVDHDASLAALREVLELDLAGSTPRVGRFGDGVYVGPISAAVGLDLDAVYLLGLSEDVYPGRLHEDALLPERLRAATGGELESFRERIDSKHRHLLAAFGSAKNVVATFPRGDLRRSTRRLPSRWLLPTLRSLSGNKSLAATEWEDADYGDALVIAGSFAGELLSTRSLATGQEWRTRQAAADGDLDDPAVRAGNAMITARASEAFTRFDGNVSTEDGFPNFADGELLVSPTQLESFATCPHGYFVERVLGVSPLEQPEDIVLISPADLGNLFHESYDEFVHEFADSLPDHGEPWTVEQRGRLIEIAREKAMEFQRRGITGHPRLWEREKVRVMADMATLLSDDDAWRAGLDARVVTTEMAFGKDGKPPVEIVVPGGRVLMRGSADKVDVGADGTIYVTDIKTGGTSRFEGIKSDDPFAGATKLQLPVYAIAARDQFGTPATPTRALYWFVRKDNKRKEVDLSNDVSAAYAEAVGTLVASIAGGLFPAKAPENADWSWTQCSYCNPDDIGHVEVRERYERKRIDPALRVLIGLIDKGALPADETQDAS